MLKKTLLLCGIASSLLYIGIDILAALRYPAYHSYTARAISELGANRCADQRIRPPTLRGV